MVPGGLQHVGIFRMTLQHKFLRGKFVYFVGLVSWINRSNSCLCVISIHCTLLSMTQIAQISGTMGVQIYNTGFGSSSSRVQNLVKWPTFENVGRFQACLMNCWGKSCTLVKTTKVQILPAVRNTAAVQQYLLCSWHTLIFLLWFSFSIPTCTVY